MSKLTEILQERFRKKEKTKMSSLAERATDGELTVFSGVFRLAPAGEKDKEKLSELLQQYALTEHQDISSDLSTLLSITSEVKAINNQAAILHGERIKRAQELLKKYREGAFTMWLMETYGNRQTPYNFLQYYEFYSQMPKILQPKIEEMPRQAVYTLASRLGDFEKKTEVVRNYQGETKQQLISLIRSLFPLSEEDRRREDIGENALKLMQRLALSLEQKNFRLTKNQKRELLNRLSELRKYIESCEITN